MSSNIDSTLTERGNRYGEFHMHAFITQRLKAAMVDTPQWRKLSDDKKECLEMVAHKIGRILNGDPEYIDSWHDIIGYVRLVEKDLEAKQRVRDSAEHDYSGKPITLTEITAAGQDDRGPELWQPPVDNSYVAPGCERFDEVPMSTPLDRCAAIVSAMPDGMNASHWCGDGTLKGSQIAPGYAAECADCRAAISGAVGRPRVG